MSALRDICREFPERGRKLLHDVLEAHGWNYMRAAEALDYDPMHFRRLIQDLGCAVEFAAAAKRHRSRFRDPLKRK
jgi:transcriptional regulator with GAF, ATPase, and Fis domain